MHHFVSDPLIASVKFKLTCLLLQCLTIVNIRFSHTFHRQDKMYGMVDLLDVFSHIFNILTVQRLHIAMWLLIRTCTSQLKHQDVKQFSILTFSFMSYNHFLDTKVSNIPTFCGDRSPEKRFLILCNNLVLEVIKNKKSWSRVPKTYLGRTINYIVSLIN